MVCQSVWVCQFESVWVCQRVFTGFNNSHSNSKLSIPTCSIAQLYTVPKTHLHYKLLTVVYTAGGNQAAATYTLIGVAFIQFLGLVSYQIYYLLKPLFSHCHTHHDDEAAENIWRYDTSMELSMSKWKAPYTDTPYQDAAAKFVSFINLLSLSKASV